jgi:hypothetical protein
LNYAVVHFHEKRYLNTKVRLKLNKSGQGAWSIRLMKK